MPLTWEGSTGVAESVSQKWNEGLCESMERGVRHFQQW